MRPGRSARLVYEALTPGHATFLHAALADPRVYAHLGEPPPSPEALAADFARRAAGPPPERSGERWVNVAVALAPGPGGAPAMPVYVGRLEAALYGGAGDGVWGEIAYLFGAEYWGHGYATEAVTWLHEQLAAAGARALWTAVAPGNERSLALLARLGYRRVPAGEAPALGSYDAGDVRLRRILGPPGRDA
jgi:RimJ/RimL family protein N-acetyltransferase